MTEKNNNMTYTDNSTVFDEKEESSSMTFSERVTPDQGQAKKREKKEEEKEDGEIKFQFRGNTRDEIMLNFMSDLYSAALGDGPIHDDICLIFGINGKGPINTYRASKKELEAIKKERENTINTPKGSLQSLGDRAKGLVDAIDKHLQTGQKLGARKDALEASLRTTEHARNSTNTANVTRPVMTPKKGHSY